MEESLRKREEEVQKTLSSSLREREKEREQHKREEAVQHFKALMADMVSIFRQADSDGRHVSKHFEALMADMVSILRH